MKCWRCRRVPEVIRCLLLCIVRGCGDVGVDSLCATLYSGGCGGYALFMEMLEASEVSEVMRCVLFCMLDALDVMRCVLCMPEDVEGGLSLPELLEGAGGDTPCATLYTGGCGGQALFAGGAGGDALCATLYAGGFGGYALFAGGVGGAGCDAPSAALRAALCARSCGSCGK